MLFGNAVPVERSHARTLFQAAAKEGYAKARCRVANMLAGGEGTDNQPARAEAGIRHQQCPQRW
ncbi:MAG: hypothetical protein JWM59_2352 [Verrucomicrobiales bacterium]|nr:hypothetical protein [Verrucomicrobiales bacterium]